MPFGMMETAIAWVNNVNFPKGTYVSLQIHPKDFLDSSKPKAMWWWWWWCDVVAATAATNVGLSPLYALRSVIVGRFSKVEDTWMDDGVEIEACSLLLSVH